MSKQKRYDTEEEIRNEIERCKRLCAVALAEAESKEREIAEGKKYITKFSHSKKRDVADKVNWLIANIPSMRLQAVKAAQRGNNYDNRVNTVLKDTLARFRTNMLDMEGKECVGVVE